MTDAIKPGKFPTSASISCQMPALGSMRIATVRGEVTAVEVPGITTLLIERVAATSIAVLTYDPVNEAGFITQLDAAGARQVGASLINLANMLEAGSAN